MIRLRFARSKDFGGFLIGLREQISMPFTPSHVECVTPTGKWLGQRRDGGMQAREPGYDAAHMEHQIFVDLPATEAQTAAFYGYMTKSIGEPYDWKAILDYALPLDLHSFNHAICSAKVLLGLRASPDPWLQWPTTKPAHLIDPDRLMFMLSSHVEIKH